MDMQLYMAESVSCMQAVCMFARMPASRPARPTRCLYVCMAIGRPGCQSNLVWWAACVCVCVAVYMYMIRCAYTPLAVSVQMPSPANVYRQR